MMNASLQVEFSVLSTSPLHDDQECLIEAQRRAAYESICPPTQPGHVDPAQSDNQYLHSSYPSSSEDSKIHDTSTATEDNDLEHKENDHQRHEGGEESPPYSLSSPRHLTNDELDLFDSSDPFDQIYNESSSNEPDSSNYSFDHTDLDKYFEDKQQFPLPTFTFPASASATDTSDFINTYTIEDYSDDLPSSVSPYSSLNSSPLSSPPSSPTRCGNTVVKVRPSTIRSKQWMEACLLFDRYRRRVSEKVRETQSGRRNMIVKIVRSREASLSQKGRQSWERWRVLQRSYLRRTVEW